MRIILEQRPDVERPLGAGPHQGARDVLLQLVQSGLVPAETRNVKRNASKTKINIAFGLFPLDWVPKPVDPHGYLEL